MDLDFLNVVESDPLLFNRIENTQYCDIPSDPKVGKKFKNV